MLISIAQFAAAADNTQNLAVIARLVQKAAQSGARMLLLPEYSMFYAVSGQKARFSAAAEPLDGPFAAALSQLAQQHGVWLAAGLFERADAGLPYNTVVLFDDTGTLCAQYRKRRLFDKGVIRESDACRAGEQPFAPVETPAGKLGILTCYELRFPEDARLQALDGAALLYVPAAWFDGPHKALQWRTLLAARAIENRIPVFGVTQNTPGLFTGCSAAFSPTGETLGDLGRDGTLLTIKL
ncbi:nitrilase-related carbon-nitrogen hydrolase [Agathobaculum sp.]|uniref:nitrilase-related carbon-nitrogen hydrolase n=1 Tax=Agathobaculum sp. TaxID=2048138 RepID=UPI002A83C8B0|nr:nitrilase-related carbon-nitrogen hydrolase [Agathobaculum sp.]MDY3619374.1 nitrilase-related carbon-nitrogen hydrolase [Agathobaculum sp.]